MKKLFNCAIILHYSVRFILWIKYVISWCISETEANYIIIFICAWSDEMRSSRYNSLNNSDVFVHIRMKMEGKPTTLPLPPRSWMTLVLRAISRGFRRRAALLGIAVPEKMYHNNSFVRANCEKFITCANRGRGFLLLSYRSVADGRVRARNATGKSHKFINFN